MKQAFLLVTMIGIAQASPLFAGPVAIDTKDSKVMAEPAPAVEKPCTWTGIYIGGHVGYLWGDERFREIEDSPGGDNPIYNLEQDSFHGGAQAGFNLQLVHWLVLGIEADFSAGGFDDRDKIVDSEETEVTVGSADADWFAAVAGRVGVPFWKNRLLVFVKGGVAFVDFEYKEDGTDGPEHWRGDDDRVGGLIGTGVEYAINCHWSIKLEYDHFFFDDERITGEYFVGSTRESDKPHEVRDPDWDSVQVGLNFKF